MENWLFIAVLLSASFVTQNMVTMAQTTETTTSSLSTNGTCAIYGYLHIVTFDDASFNYQGVNKYQVASYCEVSGSLPAFTINAQHVFYNTHTDVVQLSYAEIEYAGHTIKLGPGSAVTVDNNAITTFPYTSASSTFTIDADGNFNPTDGNIGPAVSFDRTNQYHLIVQVPSDYSSHTCGICGNFNGDATDDLQTQNGTDVSTSTNKGQEIGDSWVIDLTELTAHPTPDDVPAWVTTAVATDTQYESLLVVLVDVNSRFAVVIRCWRITTITIIKETFRMDAVITNGLSLRWSIEFYILIVVRKTICIITITDFPPHIPPKVGDPSCSCASHPNQMFIPKCGFWCDCLWLFSGNGMLYECWDIVVPGLCYLLGTAPADQCDAINSTPFGGPYYPPFTW